MSIADYLFDRQDFLINRCYFMECEQCEYKDECDESDGD